LNSIKADTPDDPEWPKVTGGTSRVAEKTSRLSSILGSVHVPAHLARAVIEERLRNAILDGRLPAGLALRQQELATLFGVSRMPVREALRQLEAQGLLQVVQHKGAVVAPLVTGDAVQSYSLRILLESEALRLSVPRLQAQDLDNARGFLAQLELENDYLNYHFHMTLYSRAPNPRLLRLVEVSLKEEERYTRFNLGAMGLGKISQEDRQELLAAVEKRDTLLAVEVLTLHLHRGIDAVTRYLVQQEE
jgi:DNA-binding GntR family transcriptional regulator